jgi:hypothetical protein
MVTIILVFHLQCPIRVYCIVCVTHTLKSGYWFLYIVCSLCHVAIDLSDCPIYEFVASVTFEFVYTAGLCAGLDYFDS